MMERIVEPEWLDELPVADPRAGGSRRDLRCLNFCMGHAGILARLLLRSGGMPRSGGSVHLVELGAGDGAFALRLVQRLSTHVEVKHVTLVDRLAAGDPAMDERFERSGCRVERVCADVFDWLKRAPAGEEPVMVTNLFLHHFEGENLSGLLRLVAARTGTFIGCEPHRSRLALGASRCVGILGCNDVTRHDAVVSVRAGFRGSELSRLWPEDSEWVLSERRAGLFSHSFVARRCRPGDQVQRTRCP